MGLEGCWGSSFRGLSGLFLSVNFRPRGILGLQLSGIVRSFCLYGRRKEKEEEEDEEDDEDGGKKQMEIWTWSSISV